MNETEKFLLEISIGIEVDQFWAKYRRFCDQIEIIEIEKLIEIMPILIKYLKEQNHSTYQFYESIELASSKDQQYAEKLYEELLTHKTDDFQNALGNIISGLFKIDPNSAKEKTKKLITDTDTAKIVQGISSIARFDFDKHPSKEFLNYLDNRFSELIKNDESVDILAAILFVCRCKRNYLPKCDQHITALLNHEHSQIKIHLIDILNFALDINTEKEFYKTILTSLVSFDISFIGYYRSFDYMLSRLVKNHLELVMEFLNEWITFSNENSKNIKLFQSVFNEIHDTSIPDFQEIITRWLNDDNVSFQIATFSLMREMSYRNISSIELSTSLLKDYSFYDIEYITFKIIGFVYDRKLSRSMLYSILHSKYEDTEIVPIMKWVFVDYLIFNYYSTIDFLKEKNKKAPSKLKKVISQIIKEGEKLYLVYSDLDVLKEFEPSRERLKYIDKIQNKKMQKAHQENEKNDTSFLSQITSLHFRAGKKAFGKFGGKYSQEMEPKLFSQSEEMPRGENIDPVGQAVLRLESQNFIRRQ
ncbi:hypothetical protein DS884_07345 [Tenacibaculum sp. E3R01]|nr:hypothetical protein DS884_07345 [Tenacibaculum sp. E3R01]